MRKLSNRFTEELQTGFPKSLREAVTADPDLDLYLRNNYLNVYFKGNSLINVSEKETNGNIHQN